MIDRAYIIATSFVLATAAIGQVPASADTSPSSREAPRPYVMTVPPAAEAKPPLRYALLPELLDQTPGNALPLYYTALDLIDGVEGKEPDKFRDSVYSLLEQPLREMPLQKAREILERQKSAFEQIDIAARRETCAWDLPVRSLGISMPLPSLARFRLLGRLVALQARVQIAEGRLDDACRTIQTGLALARHIAEAPVLVHALVAVAVADVMLQRVQELVQQPDAPNLYWALAGLPRPFIDARKAMQFEKAILFITIPQLRNLADAEMTPRQWNALIDGFPRLLQGESPSSAGERDWKERLGMAAVAIKVYPAAKEHLAACGFPSDRIKAMPVQKAVLLYLLDQYVESRDSIFRWFNMPYWQSAEALRDAEKGFAQNGSAEINPFTVLLPSISRAHFRMAQLERTIVALQCVEAVRMYAAAHNGRLPASLDAIRLVPIPIDPTTGRLLRYEASGDRFVLESPPPPGFGPRDGIRYEVTVRK